MNISIWTQVTFPFSWPSLPVCLGGSAILPNDEKYILDIDIHV